MCNKKYSRRGSVTERPDDACRSSRPLPSDASRLEVSTVYLLVKGSDWRCHPSAPVCLLPPFLSGGARVSPLRLGFHLPLINCSYRCCSGELPPHRRLTFNVLRPRTIGCGGQTRRRQRAADLRMPSVGSQGHRLGERAWLKRNSTLDRHPGNSKMSATSRIRLPNNVSGA